MAMIFCQDCGTQISTEAINCPKCGRATKPKPTFSILRVIGMLAICLFAGWVVLNLALCNRVRL